jgi:hypothetical protein
MALTSGFVKLLGSDMPRMYRFRSKSSLLGTWKFCTFFSYYGQVSRFDHLSALIYLSSDFQEGNNIILITILCGDYFEI